MGDQDPSEQRPPMWAPYGFVPFGVQSQNAPGQMPEQMPMQMAMMNPMMSPMMNPMMAGMMRGSGYGQVQFPPQMMMPQIPNQRQLPQHEDEDDPEGDDIAANYPTSNWTGQGMVYPMMMMVPYNQQSQYPDVVEDGAQEEFVDATSEFPNMNNQRFDHDMAPDVVRAAIETEPTYMNEKPDNEQPDYANTNILLSEEDPEPPKPPQASQTPKRFQSRTARAKSVQPSTIAGPLYQNNNSDQDKNYEGKKYNTYRSPRTTRSQSVVRSPGQPLARSLSTASHIHAVSELNRPPTVLHIPDIKPRSDISNNWNFISSSFLTAIGPNLFLLTFLFQCQSRSLNVTGVPSQSFAPRFLPVSRLEQGLAFDWCSWVRRVTRPCMDLNMTTAAHKSLIRFCHFLEKMK